MSQLLITVTCLENPWANAISNDNLKSILQQTGEHLRTILEAPRTPRDVMLALSLSHPAATSLIATVKIGDGRDIAGLTIRNRAERYDEGLDIALVRGRGLSMDELANLARAGMGHLCRARDRRILPSGKQPEYNWVINPIGFSG